MNAPKPPAMRCVVVIDKATGVGGDQSRLGLSARRSAAGRDERDTGSLR